MNSKDVDIYLKRYNERLHKFGYSPESLGWGGGKEKQFLRFETLCEIGVGENDSILDVGCGFADMYAYLQTKQWKGKYLGIDINDNLLELARKAHVGVDVKQINILYNPEEMKFDWVISSGVFNAKLSFEDNFSYIKAMLKRMFEICLKGVAVDFMSTYVDFQHPDAYHTSPHEIINFAKKELNAKVIIRMDYLPYEYAVYLKK